MSAFTDLVMALSPLQYYRLNESSGTALVDFSGTLGNGLINNTPTLSQAGATDDGDTCMLFTAASNEYCQGAIQSQLAGATAFSFNCFIKCASSGINAGVMSNRWNNSNLQYLYVKSDNTVELHIGSTALGNTYYTTTDTLDFTDWTMLTVTYSAGTVKMYVNSVEYAFSTTGAAQTALHSLTGAALYIATKSGGTPFMNGNIDEVMVFGDVLTGEEITSIYEAAGFSVAATDSSIPLLLTGGLLSGSAVLPMWLRTSELAGAASVPMKLQAPDPAHYQATKAKWDVQVLLDNVDISDRLVGLIEISHEESASGTCTVRMIPAAGAIDPDAFERKPLVIEFQGKNDAGTIIYASRRFTGISSGAIYDPDAGIVAIEGTTDLQGRIENMSRDTIAALVGGEWSEHVFDEDADNWQYAQDRLSTTPTEIHANRFGSIVAAPWAAKATADIELTDADIEDKQFTIARTKRRDLVTRVRINLDFRFVRLRHREVQVNFANSFGFCHYLNWNWPLCSRDMVRSAADSNEWVRITDIAFIGLPVAGTYCTPSRGWVGGADAFCLGASWRSAMRWAQTVTEEYAIDVVATDLEEAVGQQQVAESYGIEATYDGNDFEAVKAYSTSPLGAVFSTVTDDWQKEATDSERDGRAAMEYAQEVAIARARTTMLDRARRNRLTVYPVYDPSIDIDQTVRVATTYLTAKGKVAAMREMMDTSDGDIVMAVEIALSRHGGTGLASDDPIEAAEQPDQPTEEPTPRVYYVPYRMGGLVNAPQDDDEWDGYMTNVQESLRDPSGGVYQQRLVLKMPAIEESARDAQAIPQTASFEVEIPEDELTMSY